MRFLRAERPLAILGSVTFDSRMNSSPNVIASQKIWLGEVLGVHLRQTAFFGGMPGCFRSFDRRGGHGVRLM